MIRKRRKFRAAIVGANEQCAEHAAALNRVNGVALVGIFDSDTARAQQMAARLGVPAMPSIASLRHAGAEVIHILTAPRTHARIALEAMDQGCHVHLAQSAASDVADCRAMECVADARGLQICVGHPLLFDPQIRRALTMMKSGKLGRVVAVDYFRSASISTDDDSFMPARYSSAGAPFRDLGAHALYLFEAFLGPIEHVQADWKSLGGAPEISFDEWRAQVRCRNGMAQCQLSWNVRPLQNLLIVQGTKRVVRIDLDRMTTVPIVHSLMQLPRAALARLRGRSRPSRALQNLLAEFYAALEFGEPAPIPIADAKRIVQWTERVARLADQDHHRRIAPLRLSQRVPVLVTGATSVVGRAIIARLRDEGKQVRVFVRKAPEWSIHGVEVAVGDLADAQAVDRAVCGAEVVIHIAAAVGTENIVNACVHHQVKKLLHLSTMSVLDWVGADGADEPLRESSPVDPTPDRRDKDTRAKLLAEQIVLAAARDKGLAALVLRPGQIFGGRISLLSSGVARRFANRWFVFGDGQKRVPLIHIDDVVHAIRRAMDLDVARGEIIHLIGDSPPTQRDVLQAALGGDERIIYLPRWMALFGAILRSSIGKVIGRPAPASLYQLRAEISRCRMVSENHASLDGWQPTITLHAQTDGVSVPPRSRLTASLASDEVITTSDAPVFNDARSIRSARA